MPACPPPHHCPAQPATPPVAAELLLATSPSGIAVLHVYDAAGRRLETCTGTAPELRAHAAKYHPGLAVKQINA